MTFEDLATKQDVTEIIKTELSKYIEYITNPTPKWVRREEASKILGVSFDTLSKLRAEGMIRSAKTDRIIFYNISSLYEYLDNQSTKF